MVKYHEFKAGTVHTVTDPGPDVHAPASDVFSDEDEGAPAPGAQSELEEAQVQLYLVKINSYLRYVRKKSNWQKPLPDPLLPEDPVTNKRPRFDLLEWYDSHEEWFPEVVQQGDMWQSAVPTEADCETMFSIVGALLSIKRRRMSMECLSDLVYIHHNWPKDPTIDFDVFKGVNLPSPQFTADYKMPGTWEEFCELEAAVHAEEFETLDMHDELEHLASEDDDEQAMSSASEDEMDPMELSYGMRG